MHDGIDRAKQAEFLDSHHIANKTDCAQCWARPICGGGCYHEAHTRYGATTQPNLHYCEWIRGWTHTCLEIYGELAVKNPASCDSSTETPMKHLNAINRKAALVVAATEPDVVGLQQSGPPQQPDKPHIPAGCATIFSPGWEADHAAAPRVSARRWSATCSTATWAASGRRRYSDQLNHAPDWTWAVRRGPEGLAQDRSVFPG